MGMYDRARSKADARIRRLAGERLEPGESVELAFPVQTPLNAWVLLSILLPVSLILNLTRYAGWTPVALGASVGLYFGVTIRSFYLVLTSDRLVVWELARMSSTRVIGEHSLTRPDIERLERTERSLTDLLTIESHSFSERLQVAKPFRDRARDLVTRLDSGEPGAV